jgi:branched-subunit amino acid aminotransferase/4-amino-4-deoxychorismate lyase
MNGRKIAPTAARISVFDNSLLYGEGLFETLLAVNGQPINLKEHLDRLYRGAQITGVKIQPSKADVEHWIERILHFHSTWVAKVRITVTTGESGRWVGIQGPGQFIISASPHEVPDKPFKLHVSEFKLDADSPFRNIKTLSYGLHAAAFRKAQAAKSDDALMLNNKGKVAETTSANIFWVKKGQIYTTPLNSGCLEGVTRKQVMVEAKKLGFKVAEKDETVAGIGSAEEVFITSSLKLATPVGKIVDGKKTYSFKTGPVTRQISDLLAQITGI